MAARERTRHRGRNMETPAVMTVSANNNKNEEEINKMKQ